MFDPNTCDYVSLAAVKAQEKEQPASAVIRLLSIHLAAADELKNRDINDFSAAYHTWEAGVCYQKGTVLTNPFDNRQYILAEDTLSAADAPPHTPELLSLYRPVPRHNDDGSFIFIQGQNVFEGEVYQDPTGSRWKAKQNILPCTQSPAAGEQWGEI